MKRNAIDVVEMSMLKGDIYGKQTIGLRKDLVVPASIKPSGFLKYCTIIEVGYVLEVVGH